MLTIVLRYYYMNLSPFYFIVIVTSFIYQIIWRRCQIIFQVSGVRSFDDELPVITKRRHDVQRLPTRGISCRLSGCFKTCGCQVYKLLFDKGVHSVDRRIYFLIFGWVFLFILKWTLKTFVLFFVFILLDFICFKNENGNSL